MRRRALLLSVVTLLLSTPLLAQQDGYRTMARGYEDNDIISIEGAESDKGYSNGTRLDLFYLKDKRSRFFLDRLMPKAGDSSINTFGWGLMHIIITPEEIWKRNPNPADYPYAGALFVTHSLHATNPVKHYDIQTELLMGIMGPPALAGELQKMVHRLENYIQPQGWPYQLKTDPLLNLSVSVEKQLLHIRQRLEVIGGIQGLGGTAMNGASLYSVIRFGKMEPYFKGYISQFSHKASGWRKPQLYFVVRPAVTWMATNALLDGGVFNHNSEHRLKVISDSTGTEPAPAAMERIRVVGKLDYGVVLAAGRFGISYTQSTMTPMIKASGSQNIGNISVYVAW